MARPKAEINWQRVDQMLMAQCDGVMIADSLGVHPDTLYKACERDHKLTFTAYSQQKRSKGVATAREIFYRQAWVDNNDGQQATRQIFWLKNHADMSDKREIKQDIQSSVNIKNVTFELPDNKTSDPSLAPLPPGWDEQIGQ